MRRLLLAALILAAPSEAADTPGIDVAETRLAALEARRREQQDQLAEAQGPLVRLLAGVERLALRPAGLSLAQPRSTDDIVRSQALLRAMQPALLARAAALKQELATTRALREEAMRTLEDIAAGRTGLAQLRNRRLAALPVPPMRADAVTPPPAPAYRLPVAGQVVIGTGERADGGWRARGLTLATAGDAGVVAPAAGRVGYAGAFGGYGAIVVLDHGGGWTSLLTGLARAEVATGAVVPAGARLGRMGATARRLTLELRHRGRVIDAAGMMAW